MQKSYASILLNSPIVLLLLLTATIGVAFQLHKNNARATAPMVADYNLSAKPNVLVIGYRAGCGCDAHCMAWMNNDPPPFSWRVS